MILKTVFIRSGDAHREIITPREIVEDRRGACIAGERLRHRHGELGQQRRLEQKVSLFGAAAREQFTSEVIKDEFAIGGGRRGRQITGAALFEHEHETGSPAVRALVQSVQRFVAECMFTQTQRADTGAFFRGELQLGPVDARGVIAQPQARQHRRRVHARQHQQGDALRHLAHGGVQHVVQTRVFGGFMVIVEHQHGAVFHPAEQLAKEVAGEGGNIAEVFGRKQRQRLFV